MNCFDVERALLAARDGEPVAAADLQAHAASCAPCARLLAEERAMRDALAVLKQQVARTPVPAGFVRAVRRRAAAEAPAAARRSRPVIAGLALAAAVLAAAVLIVANTHQPHATPRALPAAARAGAAPDVTPVVWSDGDLDIVAAPEPQPGRPAPVLVEWDL